MSVGGTVVETIVLADRVWVNTKERPECRSDCAIYVEKTAKSRTIGEGDCVWWQGREAYWTPKFARLPEAESKFKGHRQGKEYEIVLKRIGYSGVPRPEPTP